MATPYHIAKLGVHVLTRSYAQLLMPKGITVNMISPGFLENSVGTPPQELPAGHPGRFEDILGALDYLLSERARHVSGTNLLVTGAWNLG
jgi:3-oxoacyl-[acyl-carrier protein] reductase